MAGPLEGLRIIEFAGIGPAPFAAMMLADHGAEVITIDRPSVLNQQGISRRMDPRDALMRSRKSIVLDMKKTEALGIATRLCVGAAGIIEGYRPGVMERLGLGPDVLLAENPALVYGRMTGWGQYGPFAHAAGHDINYIALSGILSTVARKGEKPLAPVNYLGDFAGGGMMLAFAMVSALLGVQRGLPGQVIDCAMTDGAALIGAMTYSHLAMGLHSGTAGENLIDGGAPFYDVYACSDAKYIALGAIEPQFYAQFRALAGIDDDAQFDGQFTQSRWPELKALLTAVFLTKTRDEWCALLEATDACFAPVLSLCEAPLHPHNIARATFVEVGGAIQPAPAPRYSLSTLDAPRLPPRLAADTDTLLAELGYDAENICALRADGALG